jgi:hypothetical protein
MERVGLRGRGRCTLHMRSKKNASRVALHVNWALRSMRCQCRYGGGATAAAGVACALLVTKPHACPPSFDRFPHAL